MSGVMIGIGEVRVQGNLVPAPIAPQATDLEPHRLAPKDCLAESNGTPDPKSTGMGAPIQHANLV